MNKCFEKDIPISGSVILHLILSMPQLALLLEKMRKRKRKKYINTVDNIERITGIDFFPSLPDEIENVVDAYANIKDW